MLEARLTALLLCTAAENHARFPVQYSGDVEACSQITLEFLVYVSYNYYPGNFK